MSASSVVRGCGTRQPGGAYLVTGLGEDGIPLEDLIVDPPLPVDPEALGLAKVGMALATVPDRPARILDWVGASHYPNVADFVEEAAAFGTSRRVPSTFDFRLLGPGSQHLLIHPKASVTIESRKWLNAHRAGGRPWLERMCFLYRALRRKGASWCPFSLRHEHEPDSNWTEMCATLWWQLLEPATLTYLNDAEAMEAQVQREEVTLREMPSLRYHGYSLPDADVWAPAWQPAAFMALPITRVEVVRDPGDMTHEITLSRARRAHIPVVEVDE